MIRVSSSLAAQMRCNPPATAVQPDEIASRTVPLKTRLRIRMAQLCNEARNLTPAERSEFVAYCRGLVNQVPVITNPSPNQPS